MCENKRAIASVRECHCFSFTFVFMLLYIILYFSFRIKTVSIFHSCYCVYKLVNVLVLILKTENSIVPNFSFRLAPTPTPSNVQIGLEVYFMIKQWLSCLLSGSNAWIVLIICKINRLYRLMYWLDEMSFRVCKPVCHWNNYEGLSPPVHLMPWQWK